MGGDVRLSSGPLPASRLARLPASCLVHVDQDIRKSFEMFDEGRKGWLTKHELKCAVASLAGAKPSKLEIEALLKLSLNGQMDFPTFSQHMQDRLRLLDHDELLRQAFKTFDIRGVGYITIEDLRTSLSRTAPHLQSAVVDSIFREIDSDGDGRVSCRDFENMIKATY